MPGTFFCLVGGYYYGADPVPEWMKWSVHIQEALSLAALLGFVYWLVVVR